MITAQLKMITDQRKMITAQRKMITAQRKMITTQPEMITFQLKMIIPLLQAWERRYWEHSNLIDCSFGESYNCCYNCEV